MNTERRALPRFQIDAADEWLKTGAAFEILDVSIEGIGLRSNHPLKPGEKLTLKFEGGLNADLEVKSCVMTENPDEYADGEFRLGCRLTSKLDLKALLKRE